MLTASDVTAIFRYATNNDINHLPVPRHARDLAQIVANLEELVARGPDEADLAQEAFIRVFLALLAEDSDYKPVAAKFLELYRLKPEHKADALSAFTQSVISGELNPHLAIMFLSLALRNGFVPSGVVTDPTNTLLMIDDDLAPVRRAYPKLARTVAFYAILAIVGNRSDEYAAFVNQYLKLFGDHSNAA